MTRSEYIKWAKQRALEYLDNDTDPQQALRSFISDCAKREDMPNELIRMVGRPLFLKQDLNTVEVRAFINGFYE